MFEDDVQENTTPEDEEQVQSESGSQSTPQFTEAELEAREMGWRPKSEWKGDPDDFVSAKEYIKRKSFYDRISSDSKKIKELSSVIEEFKEHKKNLETYTRKQILEELKAAKKQALLDGDPDKVIEVDEAIVQFKMEEKKVDAEEKQKKEEDNNGLHPNFIAWKAKNKWYDSNDEMQDYANARGLRYRQQNPDSTPEQVLAHVEKEVKTRFKEHFENMNRTKAAPVESSTAGEGGSSKAQTKYDPSEDERRTARKYVKQGLYKNENEYYAELTKLAQR